MKQDISLAKAVRRSIQRDREGDSSGKVEETNKRAHAVEGEQSKKGKLQPKTRCRSVSKQNGAAPYRRVQALTP